MTKHPAAPLVRDKEAVRNHDETASQERAGQSISAQVRDVDLVGPPSLCKTVGLCVQPTVQPRPRTTADRDTLLQPPRAAQALRLVASADL